MSKPLEIDYLKPFIEATNDAAARFRRVLIVMITASTLAFGAYWNSREKGWFNSRIVAARKGEAYLILEDARTSLAQVETELCDMEKKGEFLSEENKQKLIEDMALKLKGREALLIKVEKILRERLQRSVSINGVEALSVELENNHYARIKKWISERMMFDKEQAAEYAQKLEEARTGNILFVRIPFFGIVFDINDVGLWGGFTFTVILLIFRFSLWREYNNLRLTFEWAKPEHLEFCYMSLAMQQVLTVPPTLLQSHPQQKPWGIVVRALYLPPLLVQLAVLRNDFSTIPTGEIFNPGSTRTSIVLSFIFLVFIALLTYKCLQLSVAIDKQWKVAAKDVRKTLLDKWRIER